MLLGDIADIIPWSADASRGISELNGEGEAVGGVIVMRFGENAGKVIDSVKNKLAELRKQVYQMALKLSPPMTVQL